VNTVAPDFSLILGCASFVINSVLICLGIIIIVCTILVVDNLIHKYWKPIKFIWYVDSTAPPQLSREVKETRKNDLDNSKRT
jgi:hypothetical protein